MSNSIPTLLTQAAGEGLISGMTQNALAIPDIGQQIQNAMGIDPDDLVSSEVFGIVLDIDDSSSISMGGNIPAVVWFTNQVLTALRGSQQAGNIILCLRYLNGGVQQAFSSLDQVPPRDHTNYAPYGGTPLYRSMISGCGLLLAKGQELANAGIPFRGAYWVVTDGDNQDPQGPLDPTQVASVVEDLRRSETYLVGAVGIQFRGVNFQEVFQKCGIDPRWVLTPASTPHEIRQAFVTVSQSAIRASQSAGQFSLTLAGGFGAP